MNVVDQFRSEFYCHCHEAYSERGLIAPDCEFHDFEAFLLDLFKKAPPGEGVAFLTEDGRVGRLKPAADWGDEEMGVAWVEDDGTD